MKELRLAVIGVGHLGRIHARLAQRWAGWRLCGVVDPCPQARSAAQQELGVPAFADPGPLYGQIDAAIIATPSRTHYAVAAPLLEQGVHLLVEKPLATSLADADELIRLAARRDCVLQVGHVERFNPALAALRGYLRQPRLILAQRVGPFTGRSVDVGVVLDLMIHDLDVVLSLLGDDPLLRLEASGAAVVGPNEDWACVQLTFASGCVVQLYASRVGWRARRTMEILEAQCLAEIDFASRQSWLAQPDVRLSKLDPWSAPFTAHELNHLREHFLDGFLRLTQLPVEELNPLAEEQRQFYHALTGAASQGVSGLEARKALDLAERILTTLAAHRLDADGRKTSMLARHSAFPTLEWHGNSEFWHRKAG